MKRTTLATLALAAGLAAPVAVAPFAVAAAPTATPITDKSMTAHEMGDPAGGCRMPQGWATTGNTAGTLFVAKSPAGDATVRCEAAKASGSVKGTFDALLSDARRDGWTVTSQKRQDSTLDALLTKGSERREVQAAVGEGHVFTLTWQWTGEGSSEFAQYRAHGVAFVDSDREAVVSWRPTAQGADALADGVFTAYNGRFNYFCQLPNGWKTFSDYNLRTVAAERDADTRMNCYGLWGGPGSESASFDRQRDEVLQANGWTITSDERTDTQQVLTGTKGDLTVVHVSKRFDDRMLVAHWQFRTAEKAQFLAFLNSGFVIEGGEGPQGATPDKPAPKPEKPATTPAKPAKPAPSTSAPSAKPTAPATTQPSRGVPAKTGVEGDLVPVVPLALIGAGTLGLAAGVRRRRS